MLVQVHKQAAMVLAIRMSHVMCPSPTPSLCSLYKCMERGGCEPCVMTFESGSMQTFITELIPRQRPECMQFTGAEISFVICFFLCPDVLGAVFVEASHAILGCIRVWQMPTGISSFLFLEDGAGQGFLDTGRSRRFLTKRCAHPRRRLQGRAESKAGSPSSEPQVLYDLSRLPVFLSASCFSAVRASQS